MLLLLLGAVKEYDTPKNLMSNKFSEFYSMVQETGPQNAAFLMSVALGDDMSIDESLVNAAKQKLSKHNENPVDYGPLMKTYLQAATIMQVIIHSFIVWCHNFIHVVNLCL